MKYSVLCMNCNLQTNRKCTCPESRRSFCHVATFSSARRATFTFVGGAVIQLTV